MASAHMPLKIGPTRCVVTAPMLSPETMWRRTSEIANMPTSMGMSEMPPMSSVEPKVKRATPAALLMPMLAMASPISNVTQAFSGLAEPMKIAPPRPSITIQKNSTEPKDSAKSAIAGEAAIITTVPNMPPIAENTRPMPSANPGRPCRVI